MLSCELCCSFRAVRQLCLILLQQNSLKTPFFLRCSVLGGWGFIFGCPLRCPAQLGGSLVTICLLRLRPAGVRFTLLLQALPFCCGLRPAAMGYTLRRSLSVVSGCLSNGRLHQQWACISVGADCLGNGGRPSPTERLRDRLHWKRLESPFCLSHCATPKAVFLQSPGLSHCPSPVQSQVQPSQVSGCWFNRAPRQACPVRSAV